MKIVVSSQGETLDASASPVFGRCPIFVFVDSKTMSTEAVPNPAMSQGGGAGVQAAQFVVNQGAEAVLTGNLGPNAFDVLEAAGVPGYLVGEGTVGQAVAAFTAGQLQAMTRANVAAHAGMGGGRVMSTRGGARRGMGMGPGAPPAVSAQSNAAKEAELAELREALKGLRQQLAETTSRIENLEKEG